MSLVENHAAIAARIATACARAGRDPQSVELIWVSKTHPVEALIAAQEIGAKLFGENRVQEVLEKFPLPAHADGTLRDYELHLIGSLQRNKVRKVLPLCTTIHSVDSADLWDTINRIAGELRANDHSPPHKRIKVLIQVNTSGEDNKSGVAPGDLLQFIDSLPDAPHLDLTGLMTMGPVDGGPEAARPCFQALAALLKDAQANFAGKHPHLTKLSMGMSGDFEIAIEEGAHYVRIGTALFGGR